MSEDGSFEIELGERRFRVVPKAWPWKVARRWTTFLTRKLLSVATGLDVGAMDVLEHLTDADLERFLDDCEASTVVIELTDAGAGDAMPFAKFSALLAGRTDVPFVLGKAHVEKQLGPFFDSLKSAFGSSGAAPTSEETSG